ncbi:hypothetical protein [Radiobacillus sp. PE A8.2]|uniref:hypothetical protein n=1 Tax=Radiobacillus sp. PE A8.2 TaxID=3380349 RepID=UPI00388D94FC
MSKKNNVIDFYGYKRKKFGLDRPIFSEPTTISLGSTNRFNKGHYTVVCNLVYEDRQFLALKQKDKPEDPCTLVEGVVENQELVSVLPVKEGDYQQIEMKFKKVFEEVKYKYAYNEKESTNYFR